MQAFHLEPTARVSKILKSFLLVHKPLFVDFVEITVQAVSLHNYHPPFLLLRAIVNPEQLSTL